MKILLFATTGNAYSVTDSIWNIWYQFWPIATARNTIIHVGVLKEFSEIYFFLGNFKSVYRVDKNAFFFFGNFLAVIFETAVAIDLHILELWY